MKKLLLLPVMFVLLMSANGCTREPPLHLYEGADVNIDFPNIDLALDVLWDYELTYGIEYDWQAEWYYGWDYTDLDIFGEIGYELPTVFYLRRYHTGSVPYAPHTSVVSDVINGNSFQGHYNWGYWDMLVWNEVVPVDGVQSLHFDEESTLEYITAFTNQGMRASPYNRASGYSNSFYEPEALFSAYEQAIEINENLDGFEYDEVRHVYVKKLNMQLLPITYIYLTQIIIHNNKGRVVAVDGSADLSGMARTTVLNDGKGGSDAITVGYKVRFKKNCDRDGEDVDIIGGRLMTFGICDLMANRITKPEEVVDKHRHYMDVTMQFNNGKDSTLVFDVSDQVRKRYKGGVITIELDMDTVVVPNRSGGSGFDAVVVEPEEEIHEFEL